MNGLNELPTDVVQLIGLATGSTESYLNLSLCCKRFSKLLQKPRRNVFLQHFSHIKYHSNRKEWRINGKLHRENDLPAVEYSNGRKEWWISGERSGGWTSHTI